LIATELAITAGEGKTKVEVPEGYAQYSQVFSEEESKVIPSISTLGSSKFKPGTPDMIDCMLYPMSQGKDQALDDFIDEQLKKGYIQPSKSLITSPFFFIKKRDGMLSPVQDYRVISQTRHPLGRQHSKQGGDSLNPW
jgi:hypothetical protein